MKNHNYVVKLKDVNNDKVKEVEEFLNDKKIKHDSFFSAYQAWCSEEAEYKLDEVYEHPKWYNINKVDFKNNMSKEKFIDEYKDELADAIADDDILGESIYTDILDITKEMFKESPTQNLQGPLKQIINSLADSAKNKAKEIIDNTFNTIQEEK